VGEILAGTLPAAGTSSTSSWVRPRPRHTNWASHEWVPADVLLCDLGWGAIRILSERTAVPWVSVGSAPLTLPSRDTAPFGSGLPPSSSPLGRARNAVLRFVFHTIVMRVVVAHRDRLRRNAGPPVPGEPHGVGISPHLHLQSGVACLECPRSDLPSNAYVAPCLPYPQLLPHLSARVTNGGGGGVNEAVRHGVPQVVAGRTEEKPEVAAVGRLQRRRHRPSYGHPRRSGPADRGAPGAGRALLPGPGRGTGRPVKRAPGRAAVPRPGEAVGLLAPGPLRHPHGGRVPGETPWGPPLAFTTAGLSPAAAWRWMAVRLRSARFCIP
jgi:hypothetical protein